ncbi:hypothetical protein TGAM01_v203316 [Trichoderma gamsii]|uniref:Uncharacterized protein n=1 Tax=Trichoderma gamsii TaxID=398673 RepID=A0A2P4ZTD3_9HYPO|nr:hypothetical protein TGAM01_v203316 [Trichoderma gamsii]PON27549.1 hypothetical protein TGAM01_v203316 [Trichoderma gamsii]
MPIGFPPARWPAMLAWAICGRQRMAWHGSAWHGSAYAGDLEVAVKDVPRRRYARKSASGIAVAAGGLGREGSVLQGNGAIFACCSTTSGVQARDLGRRQPFIRGQSRSPAPLRGC